MFKDLKNVTDYFRLWLWPLFAVVLLIVFGSYTQFQVAGYKIALVSLAAWVGYWIDRNAFRDSRFHESWEDDYGKHVMLRRAIVIAAAIVGVSIGL